MTISTFIYNVESGLTVTESLPSKLDRESNSTIWVDVQDRDGEILNSLMEDFELHELAIEDALTSDHHPKIESYGKYLFLIFRALDSPQIASEQDSQLELLDGDEDDKRTASINFFVGKNFIITHRHRDIPWLDALCRQVKQVPESLTRGTDVLLHKVVDTLIDRFTRGITLYEARIDDLEDEVIRTPNDFELSEILDLKRELNSLSLVMREQKSILSRLASETTLISERQLRRYFKDIEDHAKAIIKTIDKQVYTLTSIRDVYFALANVRLGDIMRILAVITTLAVPLNLVIGLYGMNFDAIPLLHDPHGFWLVMLLIVVVTLIMLSFFRKKKWI